MATKAGSSGIESQSTPLSQRELNSMSSLSPYQNSLLLRLLLSLLAPTVSHCHWKRGGDIPPAAPIVPVAVPAPAELPATPAAPMSFHPLSAPSPPPIAPPAIPLARPDSPPSPSPAPVLRRSSRATKAHPPDGWHIPASVQLQPIADDPEELSPPNNADQTRYESPEPWDEDLTEVLAAEL